MNLYLIGPRGSGKSTVACIVAQRLGRPLIATDEWIQAETGQTIAQVFVERGEAGFRELETAALKTAAECGSAMVDLGGGAILRDANRLQIRQTGLAVWLFAPAEVLFQRISCDPRSAESRPPLTTMEGLEEIRQVLAERDAIYAACADYEIDTSALSADEVARRVVVWFSSVDKSNSHCRGSG